MPTVYRFGPYRFFFWSNENRKTREPPHIHVISGDGVAKLWLAPVRVAEYWRYTDREIARIARIVEIHRDDLLRSWHDFFDE